MSHPTITVIVPTYNRKEMLKTSLDSLLAQETNGQFTYEIAVVDDLSDDGTKEFILEMENMTSGKIRYVKGRGAGYTVALNTGYAAAKGDWIAFFDDDQLACSIWLQELLRTGINENAEVTGGPITLDIPEEVYVGMGPVYRDMCGVTHDIIFPGKCSKKQPMIAGGNRLVKRIVFDTIGTFDENMLIGGCDRDFLLRAMSEGFKTGWATKASIRHIIPVDRLSPGRVKWYSAQWGCSFAYIDWKRWGAFKTGVACIARIGQALFVHLPLYIYYLLKGDERLKRDRHALLHRALGFTRQYLHLLAPRLFSQEKFFSRVEFRRQHEKGVEK